ncbi:hypothetical protein ASPCADRAFT_4508 [Aspergillus carbonarius ITEM 5010]|uniref:Uncharacterized protein n=1 Tax=Aspergillus carbonarius (strain ITEM 5010) TaxID=602072 RepID=A0A1R3RPQ9_ASPC5|nr:hypothetical protein ASPCADRAFT_4508 [Aspergillus carbonarius ITEM 5010]
MDDTYACDAPSNLIDRDDDNETDDEERVASLENASFGIYLGPVGSPSAFNLRNDPRCPEQRQIITAYFGSVYYQGDAVEVIHGHLSPESNSFATLLVYEFRFTGVRPKSRIKWASVSFKFYNSESKSPEPKVLKISPDNVDMLQPVGQESESSTTVNAQATAGYMGVSLGASYEQSDLVRSTADKYTAVRGFMPPTHFSHTGSVIWTVEENQASQAGVPVRLRTALLLQRYTEDRFEAKVKVKVQAGGLNLFEKLVGVNDENDPVLYNPRAPPTNKLRSAYDRHHLEAVDLGPFYEVSTPTILESGQGKASHSGPHR